MRYNLSSVWWHTSAISTLGRLRQEDHEFEASLGKGNSETLSQTNK
jgi:hypothetical protein